jgi:hypothetical protein
VTSALATRRRGRPTRGLVRVRRPSGMARSRRPADERAGRRVRVALFAQQRLIAARADASPVHETPPPLRGAVFAQERRDGARACEASRKASAAAAALVWPII